MNKQKKEFCDLKTEWMQISPFMRYSIAHRYIGGGHFIDVRKWSGWGSDQFRPMKAGFCINFDEWKLLIPKIQNMLKSEEIELGDEKVA